VRQRGAVLDMQIRGCGRISLMSIGRFDGLLSPVTAIRVKNLRPGQN
jgi:hypothetical protein